MPQHGNNVMYHYNGIGGCLSSSMQHVYDEIHMLHTPTMYHVRRHSYNMRVHVMLLLNRLKDKLRNERWWSCMCVVLPACLVVC